MLPRPFALVAPLALGCVLAAATAAQQSAPGHRDRSPLPLPPDCNGNGVPDGVDLASGWSEDCNGNLVPDECDQGGRLLLSESFEAGPPPGWTFTGQWHVSSACPRPSTCSGSSYLYFGDDTFCTFAYGSQFGDVRLPGIDLPADARAAVLTFCSAYQGEGEDPYDAADVRVNGTLLDHVSPEPQLDWETRSIDLTPYLGQTVNICFEFDAMDHFGNDFLGWQIDNVRVLVVGEGASLDCNQNGVLDECELDCNANGLPDDCDVVSGSSQDCQSNGIPDECEVASGAALDCNGNLVPDECDLAEPLEDAVAALELSHATITGFFPETFEFDGGDSGGCIGDGGMNMFDCGNALITEHASFIGYTGGAVLSNSFFGIGASYFTAKHPGLFVLGAVDIDTDYFEVGGANGTGIPAATVDVLDLSVVVDGAPYRLYVKRVHGGPQPSVNQMMIVPGDGTGLVHTWSTDPASCTQKLDGLSGTERLYYVLVSRFDGASGLPLRPVDAQEIAREVIAAFPVAVSSDDNGNGIPDECE